MVENVEEANKANVKTQAGKYRALGLPVFPVNHDKVPLVPEWKYWQQQWQSEAEFQSLRWVGADSFGVPTGTKALNGYYFTAIDIDTADFDLSILPKTRIEGPTPQKH